MNILKALIFNSILFIVATNLYAQDWVPLGGGADGPIKVISEFNNQLVVAGEFEKIGEKNINYIALWDGKEYHQLGVGLPKSSSWEKIEAVQEFNGELWVGGHIWFNDAYYFLLIWDGNNWKLPPMQPNSTVTMLKVFEDKPATLYIGGRFTKLDTVDVNLIGHYTHFNPTFSQWGEIGGGGFVVGGIWDQYVMDIERLNGRQYAVGSLNMSSDRGDADIRGLAGHNRIWFMNDQSESIGRVSDAQEFHDKLYMFGETSGFYAFSGNNSGFEEIQTNIRGKGYALGRFKDYMVTAVNTGLSGIQLAFLDSNLQIEIPRNVDFKEPVNAIYEFNGELYVGGDFDNVKDGEDGKFKDYNYLVKWEETTTLVEESIEPKVMLFPNPGNGNYTIKSEDVMITEVCVFNNLGEKVLVTEPNEINYNLDITSYPLGTYFITINFVDGNMVRKRLVNVK